MIFKLIYLALFWSIDVLLYLRLSRNIIKARQWLIVAVVVWLIVLVVHLPTFHLKYLMPLNNFFTLSGMIVQLVIVYYVGQFFMRRVERSLISDEIKQYMSRWLSFSFNSAIFGLFLVVHLIFILAWGG
jgi:hypothetical protein